jgi:group I intron endonuclease
MLRSYDVYKITNKVNNKVYIGITSKGISARWKEHIYSAEHDCPFKLHRAIRKYGKENFSVELIDFANSWEELTKKEQQYISEYNSLQDEFGYNMTEGGDGTFGKVVSEETKEKIRQKAIGREVTEATRIKLSEAGKIVTEARKAYWKSGQIGATRKKPVLQYTKDGEFIAEYSGVNEASRTLGIAVSTLSNALKRKNIVGSKVNPYIWVYKEDYPDVPKTVSTSLFAKDPDWKPTISEACRKADLESRKNRKATEKQLQITKENGMKKAKSICLYDKDGNLISEYESIISASREMKCDRRSIQRQLQNPVDPNNKRAWNNAKYIWKYKEELTEQSN